MDEKLCATPTEPAVVAELNALVGRAQAGDATALPRIREILDQYPEVWRHVGDLSVHTERGWIGVLATENPVIVESMKRTVAQMKAELAGEHPTRLEQMLVDQVVVCWMEVQHLEGVAASPDRCSLEQAGFRLKALESAQRRYLAAVKMLTTTRTLMPAGLAPPHSIKLFGEERRERA